MTRRFEVGPLLLALGAGILLVSLFLGWYGTLTAWEAFEVVEVLLAGLAVAAPALPAGPLLTFGRISFALSVEDRDVRERVPVVDHRQDTTETAAIRADEESTEQR